MMSALTWIFPPSLQRWLTPDHFQRPPPQRGRSWSVESLLEWQSNSQLSTSPWRNSYQNSWMIKKKHTEKCGTIFVCIYILIWFPFFVWDFSHLPFKKNWDSKGLSRTCQKRWAARSLRTLCLSLMPELCRYMVVKWCKMYLREVWQLAIWQKETSLPSLIFQGLC